MRILVIISIVSSVILVFGAVSFAEDPVPQEPYANCSIENETFNYATSTRTFWEIDELYALPVGTFRAEDWELSSEFQYRLQSQVDPARDAHAFAQAFGTIWKDYFAEFADAVVRLKRTITRTDMGLVCTTGKWLPASSSTVEEIDTSDWLNAGRSLSVLDETSVQTLEQNLETILANLNSQPGAQ